jgi:hypothetical protein
VSWLDDMTTTIAEASGIDAGTLQLTPDEIRELLDIARIASHASGERINAPLLCHVLGIARAKGASLDVLARAVRDATGDEA